VREPGRVRAISTHLLEEVRQWIAIRIVMNNAMFAPDSGVLVKSAAEKKTSMIFSG
jgi:hypothetical protein